MLIQVTAGAAVLAIANTHASAEELAPLEVNGALLAFDFGSDATLESATESLRKMDVYVGGLIADSDDASVIPALSQLKAVIVGVQRDVEREFAYMTRASSALETTPSDVETLLHGEQHASINDSSSSNGADSSNDEELNTDGEAHTEERKPRRKRG